MKNYVILILLALLVACCFFMYMQRNEIKSVRNDNAVLYGNNNILVERLRRSNDDKMELSRTNELLKNKVKDDKSGFDWHYDLSSNPVLLEFKRLHAN